MSDDSFENQAADTKFVGSRIIKVNPESLIQYDPKINNQIRFHLPKHLGFIDFSKSFIRYDLKMQGKGRPVPDGSAHSLFRDVRVLTGDSVQIERVEDYNCAVAMWYEASANRSIESKRDLFEGRSVNTDNNSQLFYGKPGDWTAAAVSTTYERKNIKVQHALHTGVLGGKTFPIAATGLRCELTLDRVGRSLKYHTDLGEEVNPILSESPLLGNTGGSDAAKQIKAADSDTFSIELQHTTTTDQPFDIGDHLVIDLAGGGSEATLGIVTGFDVNGSNLVVNYCPDRAIGVPVGGGAGVDYPKDSIVYYRRGERLNGYVPENVAPASLVALSEQPTSYTINNVEMVLLQVEPPAQYVSAMTKAMATEKGVNIDILSWNLYKYNLTSLSGITDQVIPCTETRALSTLSIPLASDQQEDLLFSSIKGVFDGAVEYQWSYGSKLYPNRPLQLSRFAQGRVDPFALNEITKGIQNSGYMVRNMLGVDKRFLFSRAWSKQGQIRDLSQDALSLRIEYSGATKAKIFDHFVRHIVRINLSKNGVHITK